MYVQELIDSAVQDWTMFNTLSGSLRTWLAEKEAAMATLGGDKLSLQQIHSHMDKVKVRGNKTKIITKLFV